MSNIFQLSCSFSITAESLYLESKSLSLAHLYRLFHNLYLEPPSPLYFLTLKRVMYIIPLSFSHWFCTIVQDLGWLQWRYNVQALADDKGDSFSTFDQQIHLRYVKRKKAKNEQRWKISYRTNYYLSSSNFFSEPLNFSPEPSAKSLKAYLIGQNCFKIISPGHQICSKKHRYFCCPKTWFCQTIFFAGSTNL